MLAYVFALLCLYWILRSIFCKHSIIYSVLAIVSLALFLILPKQFDLFPLSLAAAILALSLIRHVKNKETPFRLSNLAGWISLYVVGGVISLLSLTFRYHENQVIGHVILKGNDQSVWTSWKNPSHTATESAWMHAYEVEVQDAKGATLFKDYLMGDYVGVRAQVILIKWPYELLGFSHLYRLELVHNGYSTAERHRFFPHVAHALPFSRKLLETVWNKLFLGYWQIPGVKTTTLESSYFPLREAKLNASQMEYDLVIGPTGLSAEARRPEQAIH
ncbi:MAG: hypothetical protein KBA81_05720 [Rhabdochlamydiaceae bacterium]|nr:hypothetical protein [Rhabdochlamydiaceae bacterium]